jgi:4-amino-4-deoxy-L-arabinose transferase-like glycosyltransferase
MTEPFAVFFILLSVLCFFKDGYPAKLIAGFLLGVGVLFKQTTILFLSSRSQVSK